MKYVLDSSVALKWALTEPDSAKAIKLREDYRNGIHELIAPDFFPIETAHALTRALMPRAFDLSSKMRIGVYDCLYVALAEQERCRVATSDQRLLNTFPSLTISLASLP